MEKIREDLNYERIIMGVDPGTNVMGYGLLGINGRKLTPIVMGVITLNKMESHYLRLARIYSRITGLVEQYLPDELAIEAPFYGKNVQSMLKLGRAQGVAMAAALARDIPIAEYAPLKVKQAVTGNGGASKEQVANMLCYILKISQQERPELLDATDALAVALTHYYESAKPTTGNTAKSWEQFLKQNPNRIVKR
ncbi:MAG: crossover junction endodeoxyribonuclease RuvC [Muribaculaceae bacterium]|nr:crossover junction endodeoxyribonuclease RuvC [Muribaculaceae bacterium]